MTPAVPWLPSCGSAPSGWDSEHTLGVCQRSTVPCCGRCRGRTPAFGRRWASSAPHTLSGRSRSVGGPRVRFFGGPGGTAAWPRCVSVTPCHPRPPGRPGLPFTGWASSHREEPPRASDDVGFSHQPWRAEPGPQSPPETRPAELAAAARGLPRRVEEPQRGFGRALLPAPRI